MNVKSVFIIVAFVAAVIPPALSIKCYVCNGKDCDKTFNCTSSLDTCMYFYAKSQKTYTRSCIGKKSCEQSADACKKTGTCVVKCCQTDLCNKDAPAPATTKPPTKPPTKPSAAEIRKPFAAVSALLSVFVTVLYYM